MPFTAHPDLLFIYKTPNWFSHGDWNAYQTLAEEKNAGYYPPLALLLFAGSQVVTRFFFSGYDEFIQTIGTVPTKILFNSEHLFQSLFLMKMPYLVFEFFLIALFLKMLPDEKNKTTFVLFWSVNPIVIYGAYMAGQLSLIPAATVAASCYFCLQPGKERYACLALGFGFLFKVFPIIFLPMVLCIVSKTMKDLLTHSLWAIVPIAVLYGGFYIVSGPAVFKIFSVGGISFATNLKPDFGNVALRIIQIGVYILVCRRIFFRSGGEMNYSILLKYFLIIYIALTWSALLSSTHYMIWFMPFLIAFITRRREWVFSYYGLIIVIFLAGLKSRASCFGIFRSLEPETFMSLPSVMEAAGVLFPLDVYYTTLSLVFKAATGCIALVALRERHHIRGIYAKI
tara:strand:+ start:6462 stop:7655 length:1194 start_codon:yes stop_codon:yes gene_type:complete